MAIKTEAGAHQRLMSIRRQLVDLAAKIDEGDLPTALLRDESDLITAQLREVSEAIDELERDAR